MQYEALHVVVNHHLSNDPKKLRDLLPLRETCQCLCDEVGDFVTTLRMSCRSHTYPLRYRLRRISTIDFRAWGAFTSGPGSYDTHADAEVVEALISAATSWQDLTTVSVDVASHTQADFLSRLMATQHPRLERVHLIVDDPSDLARLTLTGLQDLDTDLDVNLDLGCRQTIKAWRRAVTRFPVLWASLTRLNIKDYTEWEGLQYGCVSEILAKAAPHLTRLRVLEMDMCMYSVHGTQRLEERALSSSALRNLREFKLDNGLSLIPGTLGPFLRALQPCELMEKLFIDAEVMGDDDGRALATVAANFSRLQLFGFMCADGDDDGSIEINADVVLDIVQAAGEHWPLLHTLQLYNIPLDIRAARVLGGASRLACLTDIRVHYLKDHRTGLGSRGIAALLGGGAPWLDTVVNLNLSGTCGEADCDGAVQAFMRAAPRLKNLYVLGVMNEEMLDLGDRSEEPLRARLQEALHLALPGVKEFYYEYPKKEFYTPSMLMRRSAFRDPK